jgi:hypothetical protein
MHATATITAASPRAAYTQHKGYGAARIPTYLGVTADQLKAS